MPNWAFGTVKVTGTREGVKSFVVISGRPISLSRVLIWTASSLAA